MATKFARKRAELDVRKAVNSIIAIPFTSDNINQLRTSIRDWRQKVQHYQAVIDEPCDDG